MYCGCENEPYPTKLELIAECKRPHLLLNDNRTTTDRQQNDTVVRFSAEIDDFVALYKVDGSNSNEL